jgi:hypothetical protein
LSAADIISCKNKGGSFSLQRDKTRMMKQRHQLLIAIVVAILSYAALCSYRSVADEIRLIDMEYLDAPSTLFLDMRSPRDPVLLRNAPEDERVLLTRLFRYQYTFAKRSVQQQGVQNRSKHLLLRATSAAVVVRLSCCPGGAAAEVVLRPAHVLVVPAWWSVRTGGGGLRATRLDDLPSALIRLAIRASTPTPAGP